jgi:hypothetical protein
MSDLRGVGWTHEMDVHCRERENEAIEAQEEDVHFQRSQVYKSQINDQIHLIVTDDRALIAHFRETEANVPNPTPRPSHERVNRFVSVI